MTTSSHTPPDSPTIDPSHHPLASVVIPAYNAADLTVETVQSVLDQTYPNLEVIVVDDGSTDHTRKALEPFNSRISYIYKGNGGACSARNHGLRKASGQFLAFLDCDDLWLPDKLDRSIEVMQAHPEAGMVFTPCLVIDSKGYVIDEFACSFDPRFFHARLLEGNLVPAPTVVLRRGCVEQIGLFDESIFVPADWDYWLRVSAEFPVCYLDEPLSKYRFASNYSLKNVERSLDEIDYVLTKHTDPHSACGRRIRRDVKAQTCLDFALSFRAVADSPSARRMVRRAVGYWPVRWRVYAHYLASLLGDRGWRWLSAVGDAYR